MADGSFFLPEPARYDEDARTITPIADYATLTQAERRELYLELLKFESSVSEACNERIAELRRLDLAELNRNPAIDEIFL